MRHEFRLQDPGEGVHEVEIQEILISEGDTVAEGDDVLVVESDKAAIELPTPFAGNVVEIRVSKGDIAEVGDVLLVVEDDGGEANRPASNGDQESNKRSDEAADPDDGASARADDDGKDDTGADGDAAMPSEGTEEQLVPAAPAARKLAEKEGVDLADVEPSGRDGQIKVADVRSILDEEASPERDRDDSAAEATPDDRGEPRPEMVRDDFGPVERARLRSIRAATARAMSRAWAEIPHVVHQDEADVTELERWRRKLNNDDGSDQPLTQTAFLIKAAAALLQRYPRFNARLDTDADEIVLCRYYNINVAVATDRGLLTPVLRGADRKSVRVIASELAEISDRVRTGRPSKQDLTGGTFTITNVGGIGGTAFSPIINPPQSAILGFGRARLTPVVRGALEAIEDAQTEIRLMLPVILAFDHRLIDGADAARFVNDYRAMIGSVRDFAVEV